MPRKAETSPKAKRDQLRDRMRALGCSAAQIATEMSRRFNLRPRAAWRHALGWSQWKVAQQYNTVHPGARLSDNRVSEIENWPHGGNPPSLRYLARLATTFGHGCTAAQLVDADDLEHLSPADRCLLTTSPNGYAVTAPVTVGVPHSPVPVPRDRADPGQPSEHPDTQTTTLSVSRPGAQLVLPTDSTVWAATMGLQLPGDVAMMLATGLGMLVPSGRDGLATPRQRDDAYHQLVRILTSWADNMDRRNALRMLRWAATAASLFHFLDPDEQERVGAVLREPGRVDAQTIEHIETMLWRCVRQDDTLGPHAVLDTVLAQRGLARTLKSECPADLQPRLLSALSNASRHAGWLSYDLNQFDSAEYYYEDARALAHEAQNMELGSYVLCQMSQLATWQGKPRVAIDHAVAAERWANCTGDMRARAYAADVTGRAYAADGQGEACLTALDAAHTALGMADDQTPSYIHFYDEAFHISIRGLCHLELREGQRAADYAQQSLQTLDKSYTRNVAFTTIDLGRAYVQCQEIDEAARLLGDASEIAARNSSARLVELLKQGRTELQPWENTAAVHTLDDRLKSYGIQ